MAKITDKTLRQVSKMKPGPTFTKEEQVNQACEYLCKLVADLPGAVKKLKDGFTARMSGDFTSDDLTWRADDLVKADMLYEFGDRVNSRMTQHSEDIYPYRGMVESCQAVMNELTSALLGMGSFGRLEFQCESTCPYKRANSSAARVHASAFLHYSDISSILQTIGKLNG
jgi:hypothetical protein